MISELAFQMIFRVALALASLKTKAAVYKCALVFSLPIHNTLDKFLSSQNLLNTGIESYFVQVSRYVRQAEQIFKASEEQIVLQISPAKITIIV